MRNIGTKPNDKMEIIVNLAMCSTKVDNILFVMSQGVRPSVDKSANFVFFNPCLSIFLISELDPAMRYIFPYTGLTILKSIALDLIIIDTWFAK